MSIERVRQRWQLGAIIVHECAARLLLVLLMFLTWVSFFGGVNKSTFTLGISHGILTTNTASDSFLLLPRHIVYFVDVAAHTHVLSLIQLLHQPVKLAIKMSQFEHVLALLVLQL